MNAGNTKSPVKYIRENILSLEPYSTARDEFKGGNISVWLDANESPYQNGVNRYPDPHQKKVKEVVSKIFGMPENTIFLGGSGSDEAIDLTYRIFCRPGIDNAIAISPSYGVYKVAAAINDIEFREVMLNEDFSLPTDRLLLAADSHTKLIWICSPNNPTGNAFPRDEILYIVKNFDGIVVVDEAYADFSEKPSLLHDIEDNGNLIVLRTFSKAWGMAGMRVGMAFADSRLISYYNRVKYPYNISNVIQDKLLEIFENIPNLKITEIKREREKLAAQLPSAGCVKSVYDSDANFLLIKVDDAKSLYDYLLQNGVIVRNRSSLPGCASTLRITVGTPEENDRVIGLIRRYTIE